MSRTIHAPTLRFIRRISYTHYDHAKKDQHLIEYDTYEAATHYTWRGFTYGNAVIFHRRTSDGALFINEPVAMKGLDDIWGNVIFIPSMEELYEYKVRFDTPHPHDEVASRAAHERPAFTRDVIRTLLSKPLPPAEA